MENNTAQQFVHFHSEENISFDRGRILKFTWDTYFKTVSTHSWVHIYVHNEPCNQIGFTNSPQQLWFELQTSFHLIILYLV